MSVAHRTGARLMSKGMTEGKANGRLNMDELDRMAFIGTSSTNAVATDSANTMSAYMTGHKTAVNALGGRAGAGFPRSRARAISASIAGDRPSGDRRVNLR